METSDFAALLGSELDNNINNSPRILNKAFLASNAGKEPKTHVKKEDLTTKNAVKLLLEGRLKKTVCRYCLNVASPLSELDQVLQIAGAGALYKISIRDMVASFHPFKVADDPNLPNKICNKCLNRTISSYLFTQQCERSERALRNCFEDIYNKLDKLDSLDPKLKKRGRQKLHPNYNILYTDHEKVIDYAEPIINIVNSGSELINPIEKGVEDIFECLKCCRTFPNIISLLNHEKIHPKNMYYNCRHCGKSFTKRHLVKKHKRIHELGPVQDAENAAFKCAECNVVSKNHIEHLQHVEKHKFKVVMEHLLEKNMDKLCTVCFDKNGRLQDLDKMISLSGGYPEIMGDRTLYNILGSTVPDKPSYKYQELLLPAQAKIISIKKAKSIKQYNKETGKYDFKLTAPIVISKDGKLNNNIYFFEFSLPKDQDNVYTIGKENLIIEDDNKSIIDSSEENDNATTANNDLVIEPEFYVKNKKIDTVLPLNKDVACGNDTELLGELNINVFTFSKPDFPDLNKDNEKSITDEVPLTNATLSCKICWIFNKPTCYKCLSSTNTNTISNTSISIEKPSEKQCQYCWIFKNCAKCDSCKKVNNSEIINSSLIQDLEPIDKEIVSDPLLIKRKIVNEANDEEVKAKRLKWLCEICLTDNTGINLCACCDAKRHVNEKSMKVNLKYNHDFFSTLNQNTENIAHFAYQSSFNEVVNTTEEKSTLSKNFQKSTVNNDMTNASGERLGSLTKITFETAPNVFHAEIGRDTDISTIEDMEIEKQDNNAVFSEFNASPNFLPNNNNSIQNAFSIVRKQTESTQDMEIEVNNLSTVFDEFTIPAVSVFSKASTVVDSENMVKGPTTPAFNFQIGSTNSEDKKSLRKYKRPLRRIASVYK